MRKSFTLLIPILFAPIIGCHDQGAITSTPLPGIDTVFEQYHQKRLEFNPLEATQAGKTGYNDRLPNLFSESYIRDEIEFLNRYQGQKIAGQQVGFRFGFNGGNYEIQEIL